MNRVYRPSRLIRHLRFHERIFILIGCILFCLTGMGSTQIAYAGDTDVAYVDYRGPFIIRTFIQTGVDSWLHTSQYGRNNEQLKELDRDEWVVYLKADDFPWMTYELDLKENKIFATNDRIEVNRILNSRSDFFQNPEAGFGSAIVGNATDTDVNYVEYDTKFASTTGAFIQTEPYIWLQNKNTWALSQQRNMRKFKELYRDELSVFLQAEDAPLEKFQIDLKSKKILHSEHAGLQPKTLFKITHSKS